MDLEYPDPDVIGLEDVAHGLAFTCRFSGQCNDYYSIAQHAVMCARYLEAEGRSVLVQLAGLHHDDSEAFLGDVVTPLKSLLQPVYGELSDQMDIAVAAAFGDLWPADALKLPEVKEADNWALMVEAAKLLPSQGKRWTGESASDMGLWRGYQSPRTASRSFVRWHNHLVRQL